MEKFFIFLSINGTLWDRRDKKLALNFRHDVYVPESVNAVLYLMDELRKEDYDPHIVITSKDRVNWDDCVNNLYKNGFPEDIDFIKLPFGKYTRGERISIFLNDYYIGKDITTGERKYTIFDNLCLRFASNCYNYVVIDDEIHSITNIPRNQRIETSIDYRCLDKQLVDEFWNEFKGESEPEPNA